MYRFSLISLTAVAVLMAVALVQAADKGKLSDDDHKFVMSAAHGGMLEVQLGEVAEKNASHADVKAFGKHMVTDHSKANDQLKQLAKAKEVVLADKLPKRQQETYDKLSKLTGKEFDKEYMKLMVEDHRRDIEEFEKEAKSGKDADLKAFANNTLPTLRDHLKMAKETAKSVSVEVND